MCGVGDVLHKVLHGHVHRALGISLQKHQLIVGKQGGVAVDILHRHPRAWWATEKQPPRVSADISAKSKNNFKPSFTGLKEIRFTRIGQNMFENVPKNL